MYVSWNLKSMKYSKYLIIHPTVFYVQTCMKYLNIVPLGARCFGTRALERYHYYYSSHLSEECPSFIFQSRRQHETASAQLHSFPCFQSIIVQGPNVISRDESAVELNRETRWLTHAEKTLALFGHDSPQMSQRKRWVRGETNHSKRSTNQIVKPRPLRHPSAPNQMGRLFPATRLKAHAKWATPDQRNFPCGSSSLNSFSHRWGQSSSAREKPLWKT